MWSVMRFGTRWLTLCRRALVCWAALVACAGAPAAGARATRAPAAAPTSPPGAFRPVLDSVYGAIARGDSAALRPWLADNLVWTDGGSGAEVGKAQRLAASGRPSAIVPRFDVDSVRAQRTGEVALVSFRRVDRRTLGTYDTLGTYESTARWRVLDVFAWRGGRWQLVRHTQTWLVAPVTPLALDSAVQQAFVGRYAVAPGVVDSVHWTGGALWATITGFPPGARLVPVGASAFSPDGTGALIAFERDAAGRVTGYVQGYPDGRVLRRPKLP